MESLVVKKVYITCNHAFYKNKSLVVKKVMVSCKKSIP